MIHLKIAEAGKRLYLDRDYPGALERFRSALHMAVQSEAPPVFAQHYTECILDTLEAAGSADQALALVERAIADQDEDAGQMGQILRAHMMQRRVLLLFTMGREDEADAALSEALPFGGPVLTALSDARRRRLRLTPKWISDLKAKHGLHSMSETKLRGSDAREGEDYFKKESVDG